MEISIPTHQYMDSLPLHLSRGMCMLKVVGQFINRSVSWSIKDSSGDVQWTWALANHHQYWS